MTNLSNFSENFKRFGWIIAVVILALIFVALILFRFSNGKTTVAPQPTQQIQFDSFGGKPSQFNSQNLTLPSTYPETLPLYQPAESSKNLLAVASTFATKFGFKNQPTNLEDKSVLGNGLLFSDPDKVLSVYKYLVTYQKYLTQSPPATFNILQLKQKALALLSNLQIVNLNDPQTIFMRLQGETLGKTQEKDAAFVRFHFTTQLSGLPIVSSKEGADVTLDSAGNVIQFSYRESSFNPKEGSYKIISPQQALANIDAQGSLINVQGNEDGVETIKALGVVNLRKAYLAYYLPIKTPDEIQPIWIFEGDGQPKDLPITVQFAVPATSK